ncbi:ribonuclease P [archaeon]|nr:ribonuclease P [archaeon]
MKKNKIQLKKEALVKVRGLFNEADKQFSKDPKLSNKYVKLARQIAMKVNLRFPREIKRKFCKHCYFYLKPGKNCRVRVYKSRVSYYCENCKKFMRFGIK